VKSRAEWTKAVEHRMKKGGPFEPVRDRGVGDIAPDEGYAGPKQRGKYKNEPTWVDGIRFDSKKEAKRYQELKLLEQAHEIWNVHRQVEFPLTVMNQHICNYVADFVYLDNDGGQVVEDVKGVKTREYKLKKKLMKAIYGIEIKET